MEEQLEKHFSEYEKLLKTKDYHLLSDQEKIMVNSFSSEEEYDKMRNIILSNEGIIDAERKMVSPDAEILNNLIHTMKSKQVSNSIKGVLKSIFNYKVPAYQFVIGTAVLVLIIIFVFKREKIITIDRPVYITKTDTIEKYINKETKPIINKIIKTNTNTKKTTGLIVINIQEKADTFKKFNYNTYSANSLELMGININLKEKIENFKPKGRTMHDDSLLVKFLVKI